ncbi:MAG TPA: KGG domain-containing protein [Chitinophaga sp.]|uniref:KGG domain-containing protein n=1 Tax=Chitinophaga sp. TaxID=1869181 RepID=UPI002C4DF105|nr:KGG domain-containing protein [Chitinophaga sp.]HVI43453.1 KGG domain-containing protein [Chitinophaga sp.]
MEHITYQELAHSANTQVKSQTDKSKHSKRGFASMDPEQQRAISREGGRAAHQQGVAHKFTSEEARAAGKKGGEAVSRNREHMAAIGRKGGTNRGKKKNMANANNPADNI